MAIHVGGRGLGHSSRIAKAFLAAAVASYSPTEAFTGGAVGGWWFLNRDAVTLANNTVWADTARTTAATVGGLVAAVTDLSGNGKHAVQSNTTYRPTLQQASDGRYWLDFSGNKVLRTGLALTQPFTRIAAFRQRSWTSARFIFGSVGTANWTYQANVSPQVYPYAGSLVGGTANLQIGDDGVLLEIHNGASSQVALDAEVPKTYNIGAGNSDEMLIGARDATGTQGSDMRFYGAVAINGALSFYHQRGLRTYLNGLIPQDTTNKRIRCVGDSLTVGTGSTGSGAYPLQLQALLGTGWTVFGEGISSQTSPNIAARINGIATTVSLASNTMPASGAVAVTILSPVRGGAAVGDGPLAYFGTSEPSFYATITTDNGTVIDGIFSGNSGTYTFTRLIAGSSLTVSPGANIVIAQNGRNLIYNVIWAGRNNIAESRVITDVQACVAANGGTSKCIVIGVTNARNGAEDTGSAAYNQMIATNSALAAAYPSNFIDIWAYLRSAQAFTDASVSMTATDTTDIAAGRIPLSWFSDASVHFNNTSYALIAAQVKAKMVSLGWAT